MNNVIFFQCNGDYVALKVIVSVYILHQIVCMLSAAYTLAAMHVAVETRPPSESSVFKLVDACGNLYKSLNDEYKVVEHCASYVMGLSGSNPILKTDHFNHRTFV